MGLKTLTETLMGGEVDKTQSMNLYGRVASSEMFGYAMSSGFGSGIGSKGSGFMKGNSGSIRRDLGFKVQERYDWSGHNGTMPHLNHDVIGSSFKLAHVDLRPKKK